MSPQRQSRKFLIGSAFAALLAPLALVASVSSPAQASAPRPHHVKMYKVEAHVDLSGEFPDNTLVKDLSCDGSDYVLDGMWRVDHVDQANPDTDTFGDERDVQVLWSYGDNANASLWHFKFSNGADGDAQLKIFLTCMQADTEGQHGHSHPIVLSNRKDMSHAALASGTNTFDHTATCVSGEVVVAPGFKFTTGYGRPFRSWPTSDFYGWHWGFLVSGAPADVDTYYRCLQIKTGAAGNGPHAHNLYTTWDTGWGGTHYTIPVNTGYEVQQSCESKFYDKGMVAGFWIDDPWHTWWLGMDPRPKTRAFRYWNTGGGSVWSTLLCVGSRTGKQIAP
ncbi:MAG: hypothetical protein JWN22_2238 [Nocardioides sp.]|nr:hypothetical protein [Nocardioides sp.]